MRARILVFATAAVVLLVTGPTPAVAGGWWTYIDVPDALGVGETVTAEARVMFPDTRTAEAAMDDGEFHAYLVRGVGQTMLDDAMSQPYRAGWWEPPSDRTWLAPVELSARDSNLVTATATFEVPAVTPGRYALMLCTLACEEAMGDVVPRMHLRVYAEPTTAGVAREVTGLSNQLANEVERILLDVEEVREGLASGIAREANRTRKDVAEIEESIETLRSAVASLPAPVEDHTPWTEHAGWFVAGLATAAALVTWRRRRTDTPGDDELPPVPDDVGELVTGPPVPVSSIRR